MAWKTLDDMDLAGKRVLVRVDINVPMEDGRVTDTTRIDRIVPTITDIVKRTRGTHIVGVFVGGTTTSLRRDRKISR